MTLGRVPGERKLRRRAILCGSLLGPCLRGPRRIRSSTATRTEGAATHWFGSDREKYDILATAWVLP